MTRILSGNRVVALALLIPLISGCSYWGTLDGPLAESLEDGEKRVRFSTDDNEVIEATAIHVSGDTLFCLSQERGPARTSVYAPTQPESAQPEQVSFPLQTIQEVKIRKANWPATVGLILLGLGASGFAVLVIGMSQSSWLNSGD